MFRTLVAVAFTALLAGCSLNKAFVKSVNDYSEAILPEYKQYIKRDPVLDDDTKRIRLQSAEKFQELIDDAMKEAGDE